MSGVLLKIITLDNKLMLTAEEKKQVLIRQIRELPETQLDRLEAFIQDLNKTSTYLDQEQFQHLLKENSVNYQEVWKRLA